MGCDIHMRVEAKVWGDWALAHPLWPCWNLDDPTHGQKACYYCHGTGYDRQTYHNRNYNLFAILANVRNGTWGEALKFIAAPRGKPKDASAEVKGFLKEYGSDGHSHSWVTIAEIDAFDWTQHYNNAGYIHLAEYVEMRRTGKDVPDSYSGGIYGPAQISLIEAEKYVQDPAYIPRETDVRAYVQYFWTTTYRQAVGENWFAFVDCCRKLAPKPEDIRLCFFFDN